MAWSDQIFRYCERGADPGFWAEPLNAVSNAAFILAAAAAASAVARQPREARASMGPRLLIALVLVIGVGSFLFHTFATKWAGFADVIPIGIFMLAYLGYALRTYLGLGWVWTTIGLVLYMAALRYAGDVECRPSLISTAATVKHCLNGTAGYAPALLAMLGIGGVLAVKGHTAARYLLAAGGIFFVSMLFRTIDLEVCDLTRVGGHALGTHFLWHILNGTALYLLLRAAILSGRRPEHSGKRPVDSEASAPG